MSTDPAADFAAWVTERIGADVWAALTKAERALTEAAFMAGRVSRGMDVTSTVEEPTTDATRAVIDAFLRPVRIAPKSPN